MSSAIANGRSAARMEIASRSHEVRARRDVEAKRGPAPAKHDDGFMQSLAALLSPEASKPRVEQAPPRELSMFGRAAGALEGSIGDAERETARSNAGTVGSGERAIGKPSSLSAGVDTDARAMEVSPEPLALEFADEGSVTTKLEAAISALADASVALDGADPEGAIDPQNPGVNVDPDAGAKEESTGEDAASSNEGETSREAAMKDERIERAESELRDAIEQLSAASETLPEREVDPATVTPIDAPAVASQAKDEPEVKAPTPMLHDPRAAADDAEASAAVRWSLLKSAQGSQVARVQLDHPTLGALELDIAMADGEVDFRVLAPTLLSAITLERDAAAIRRLVQEHGARLGAWRVEVPESARAPRPQPQNQNSRRALPGRVSTEA